MRTAVLLVITVVSGLSAFAQNPGQLCYFPSKADEAKRVCRDISPALKKSLADVVAAEVITLEVKAVPVTAPKFKGVAHLIFATLDDGLFLAAIERFPPAAVRNALDAEKAGSDVTKGAKATAIGKTEPVDPQ